MYFIIFLSLFHVFVVHLYFFYCAESMPVSCPTCKIKLTIKNKTPNITTPRLTFFLVARAGSSSNL